MDNAISQEKANEYMQVAAMVCLDLDILKDIAESREGTAEELVRQILHTWKMKEQLISDPAIRTMRYEASSMLFSASAAGLIQSTEIPSGAEP